MDVRVGFWMGEWNAGGGPNEVTHFFSAVNFVSMGRSDPLQGMFQQGRRDPSRRTRGHKNSMHPATSRRQARTNATAPTNIITVDPPNGRQSYGHNNNHRLRQTSYRKTIPISYSRRKGYVTIHTGQNCGRASCWVDVIGLSQPLHMQLMTPPFLKTSKRMMILLLFGHIHINVDPWREGPPMAHHAWRLPQTWYCFQTPAMSRHIRKIVRQMKFFRLIFAC